MQMRAFILLAVLAATAIAPAATADKIYVTSLDLASEEGMRDLYERWYALYRSDGGGDAGEKAKRFDNFKTEARIVYQLNEGNARLKYHLNWLADLTHKEYSDEFANCCPFGENQAAARVGERLNRHQPSQYYPDNLPLSVDWRSVDGVLTSVKNQGRCGSCWAFAAAGAMESVNFLENKRRTNLSVQELVDCSSSQGNLGCKGGWASWAFQYVIDNLGIRSWEQYPYVGNGSSCPNPDSPMETVAMTLDSFYHVESHDEKMLMDAVTQNPVVVLILGANTTEFRSYGEGVFRGPCDTEAKHQALLVGYGTTPNDDPTEPGVNFWIIKNSWGTAWGEEGYMRLQRGYEAHGGLCGIMLNIVYPANAYSELLT